MAAKTREGNVSPVAKQGSSQLWLSLLEDATKVEWPPTLTRQEWRVVLTSSESLQGCNHTGLYRTSPVFPATKQFFMPDLRKGTYHLSFFCFDPAFPVLGRLLQKASEEIKNGLLYTTGLASILLVSKRAAAAENVERIAGVSPQCKELWKVDQGT
jgi:hypothetical protein